MISVFGLSLPGDLPIIWFFLIAVLFTMYFFLEGFDFGVGMLLPFLGTSETKRKAMIGTIGPVWDGNEVWLITAGGALFAAFPNWYATMFSGFYLPLFLILLALIVRIVGLEWRHKVNTQTWRSWCDLGIIVGSYVPPIVWGVAMGNLVRGVPIDDSMQMESSFSAFVSLFNPFALVGALAFTALFLLHGIAFLTLKTSGPLHFSAQKIGVALSIAAFVFASGFALWLQIQFGKGWTWAVTALIVIALAVAVQGQLQVERLTVLGFIATSLAIVCLTVLIFGSLYPNVMPTTLADGIDLSIWNASSSTYVLRIMTWVAVFMTPIVLIYQGWTYWVFRKRISTGNVGASA